MLVAQSCLALRDPMDCSRSGSFVHIIPQARILEWIAFPFSRGPSQFRDWTQVSHIEGWFFTVWATREVQRASAPPQHWINDHKLSALWFVWRQNQMFQCKWEAGDDRRGIRLRREEEGRGKEEEGWRKGERERGTDSEGKAVFFHGWVT